MALVALGVAVVAVVVAIWSLSDGGAGSKSSSSRDMDPKTRICTAFDTVSKAVTLQTHHDLGADPVAQAAVAANGRLTLVGGGQYLLDNLEPSTPRELADPIRVFAYSLQDIGIDALAGGKNSDPAQASRMAEGEASRKLITDLCR